MIFKLSKTQFDYLDHSLSEQKEILRSKLQVKKEEQQVFVIITEIIADEIRDWANEQLQVKGFNINYELTAEGKILEELVDIFYT